jgi:hypothetical protein
MDKLQPTDLGKLTRSFVMGQQGLWAIRLYPNYGSHKLEGGKPEDTETIFMKERTLDPQQTKPINSERGRVNIPDDKQMLED